MHVPCTLHLKGLKRFIDILMKELSNKAEIQCTVVKYTLDQQNLNWTGKSWVTKKEEKRSRQKQKTNKQTNKKKKKTEEDYRAASKYKIQRSGLQC